MKTLIYQNYAELSRAVAARIAVVIREKPNAVLGLATGSTPLGVYEELIRLHQEQGLDFSGVSAFNLDEYFPIEANAPQSYEQFMREKLFDHINIDPSNCFIPSGLARSTSEVDADCTAYEAQIVAKRGLDLQLLGIGRTGHIGFNEPGSPRDGRTRLVILDHLTRVDAAGDFFGIENVPVRAITMGISTIMEAREILLVASGAPKSAIVAEALEGKITSKVPASFVREHEKLTVFLEESAASRLTSRLQPWLVPDADFNSPALRERTLVSIALEQNKPLAEINHLDLASVGAARLGTDLAEAKDKVARTLKSKMDDEAHLPQGKTVLCLSPHPDDDVICCGGTLLKLSARDNRTFVAFGVNGANAVRDKDVLALLRARHPRLISYLEEHLEPGKSMEDAVNEIRTSIFEREPGAPDSKLLRELKREFNLTYLFVGHDLAVIQHICDRVAVMYAGKLVEIGPTQTLFDAPRHPYTEALLSAVPRPDPRLRRKGDRIRLPGEVADVTNLPPGCAFHPRCRYATDLCRVETPPLRPLGNGQSAACHYADKLELAGTGVP
ncbi:glucosamine-6-phosphate deaminase [bacterium]|nr:MAG: glucosamine-6-phosphate deaminase [bacterium]